jgi:hypothetical protein
MKMTRVAILVATMTCAAVGLSGPASADPVSGPYTATVIQGAQTYKQGATDNWTVSSCGPDCTHLDPLGMDLQRQGNAWTALWGPSNSCTASLDNTSLVFTEACPGFPDLVIGLSKNG